MTDYAPMKVPELKKLLQSRSLPISGPKADLIARLQQDDNNKAGVSAPAAGADDEIDWDEDDATTAKPVASTDADAAAAPATTQPAAAAVSAGGQGPIDTPVNVPNQKQEIDPATTHDLKVAATATPEVAASKSPEAEKKPAPEAVASEEPVKPAEPEAPKVDFTAGIELTDAEKEAKKRVARLAKFGAVKKTGEEKKLEERATKFGGKEADKVDEATIKTLNEGLPERKKRKEKEQGGRAEGAKRQTPDRGQVPKSQKNEKKPPVPQQKQATKPATKKVLGVLDDPVEKAKAEARAAKFGSKA